MICIDIHFFFVNLRLSIPFVPRRAEYVSLEQIVKRYPDYGYQLYFSDPKTTKEIEDHVSTNDFRPIYFMGGLTMWLAYKFLFASL